MGKRRGREWRPPRCSSGKAAFRSQGRALYALKRTAIDNAQAVAPLEIRQKRVYRCAECGAFHLTTLD